MHKEYIMLLAQPMSMSKLHNREITGILIMFLCYFTITIIESEDSKVHTFHDVSEVIQYNSIPNFKNIFWMVLVLFPPQKFTGQPYSISDGRELKSIKMGCPSMACCSYRIGN
jgi:hypothetical protein